MGLRNPMTMAIALLFAGTLDALHVFAGNAASPVRYAGALPCADCASLRMELVMYTEGGAAAEYQQRLTYVDTREGDKVVSTRGHWKVVTGSAADPRATLVELGGNDAGERQFLLKLGEGALRLLDGERREIASPRPQVLLRSERRFVGDPVVVSEARANASVALRPGQELVVRLPSNPSTGYTWTMLPVARPVLTLVATPRYERADKSRGMAGASGTEVWRLSGFGAGAQTLGFEYRRPWESGAAPARTMSFSVTVR